MAWRCFRCQPKQVARAGWAAVAILVLMILVVGPPLLPSSTTVRSLKSSDEEHESPTTATVYVVTPTFRRFAQAPDLLRLSQALMLADVRIFWIVVEDADAPSNLVHGIMARSGLHCAHLVERTPPQFREEKCGKGVAQRMRALSWLRANATLPGVLYFADDDNAYDHQIFSQIARIRRIGLFPVGLASELQLSSPVVSRKGVVVDFFDGFIPDRRRYPVDMAGFAVNLELVRLARNPRMPYRKGMLESAFLGSLGASSNDWELLARNCTEVLVWHTQTSKGDFPEVKNITTREDFLGTNLPILYSNVLGNE